MRKNKMLLKNTQILNLDIAKVICFFLLILGPSFAYANDNSIASEVNITQQKDVITGVVFDESGEPIIGANVKVVGATGGAISDIDGKFHLTVAAGNKIEVSFIGYRSQIVSIHSQKVLKIVLQEDSRLLDEVVVVGYGTQRVKDLTGAASNVKVNEILDTPGASLVDALAGQVAGLSVSQSSGRPGSTGSIQVRQPMSFDGSSSFNHPLIVIDDVVQVDENGEPTMGEFNRLDPSEIESMTVLKDASAAVYGARSSAGVVLVKTKRGTVGSPKISYSGKFDFSDAVSHAKTMNAYETGIFTNRMFNQLDKKNGNDNYSIYKYSDDELSLMKNLNYDWLDRAWHSSFSQRHSLSVNGGSERATFYAGATYQNQGNNLGNVQDYNRWTFRTGGEVKVFAGLKLSASVAAYNSNKTGVNPQAKINSGPWGNQSSSQDYPMLRHMANYIPIETQIIDPITNQYKSYYVSPWVGPHAVNTSTDSNVGGGYAVWNFFANEASKARTTDEENGYNANFSLTYDIPFIKGLSVKGTYAVSYNNSYLNSVGDYYTLARAGNTNKEGLHLIGTNTEWNYINYGDPNGTDVAKKPGVVYAKSTTKTEQMNFMVSYNRMFGKHDVSAVGVIERGESEGHDQRQAYRGIGNSYNGVSNTSGTLNPDGNETYFRKYESGSLSYVGRANYKYDNRYLAQFVIRADASTKFSPENYWGIFPTGSIGWIMSEESFFRNSKVVRFIDFLRLRYSLGKTGKDNVAAWSWLQIYNISSTGGLGFGEIGGQPTFGANINGTANRNIKWDTTIKQNVGVDINVFDNKFTISTDFYYDKTKDLIMFIADNEEPIYIGAKLPAINYGKKDAWGWEISANWNDAIQQSILPSWGAIRYGIGMNYSISWNKTVLGQDPTFDYPAEVNEKSSWTGFRGPCEVWGLKTWRNTTTGDGILRTQADIDNYWQYLSDLAATAGTTPSYLGITSKDKMQLGMLAYQDINGDIDTANKTIAGPNGVISRDHGEDYVKLANNRIHNINTKLNFQWGDFSWVAQISTSWGGFNSIGQGVSQSIGNNELIWAQFAYMNDMYDPDNNFYGRFPSMAAGNTMLQSDFWQVSSFRMYIRNMTFGYSLPKQLLQKISVDRLQFTLTGNNLWDFYNPYPKKYRNMYDSDRTDYPTLRTWTLGVNLTF